MPGYHITTIPKGVLGEFSKIEEEFLEFQDAHVQECAIMELVELSDTLGAIFAYCSKHNIIKPKHWGGYVHGTTTYTDLLCKFRFLYRKAHATDNLEFELDCEIQDFVYAMIHYAYCHNKINGVDLHKMHEVTERAFLNGART